MKPIPTTGNGLYLSIQLLFACWFLIFGFVNHAPVWLHITGIAALGLLVFRLSRDDD